MTKQQKSSSFFRRDDAKNAQRNTESVDSKNNSVAKPSRERPFEKFRKDTPSKFTKDKFSGKSDSYNDRVARVPKPERPPLKTRSKGPAPVRLVNPDEPLRLNRFISQSGVCSRREADELIAQGLVTVNGVVTTELGSKVNRNDRVELEGKVLKGEKKVYIVMNKPKGYVTSLDDPHNERTVIDLLKGAVPQRVYPVGRLDKNTTGVLLLTNDGDLTKELTHPSYEKSKIYHVFLDKPCTEEILQQLLEGVELEDGQIKVDEISFVDGSYKEVGVEIHCGRNRIVRRMFEHFGFEVHKLDRVYFAGMTKMGLRRGFWRYLSEKELNMLLNKSYK